jgi:hypothetical protein
MDVAPTTAAPSRLPAGWLLSVARGLVSHPSLWIPAVAQVRRLAAPGWWRSAPYLPVPAPAYLAFRSQTMYGDSSRLPEPADVRVYLEWCRSFPSTRGSVRRTWWAPRNTRNAGNGRR